MDVILRGCVRIATEMQTKSASFSDIPFLMSPALNTDKNTLSCWCGSIDNSSTMAHRKTISAKKRGERETLPQRGDAQIVLLGDWATRPPSQVAGQVVAPRACDPLARCAHYTNEICRMLPRRMPNY